MTVTKLLRLCFRTAVLAAALAWATPAAAQAIAPCPKPMKNDAQGKPQLNLPPKDSPVLVNCFSLIAHPINETVVDGATYDYYIKAPRTKPGSDQWAKYDDAEIEAINADFWALWKTTFLDNLWIEVIDEPFENGVPAKHIIYHIEERSKVKAVDYVAWPGTKTTVDISKIEEKLRDNDVHLALDSFVDEATIRRVKGTIREYYSTKGYNDVKIEHDLKSMPAGPKLVTLTFTIDQGPKYKLAEVTFDGNHAFSDATLRSKMKANKPKAWWSFFTSGGTYQQDKYADDAGLVNDYYLDNGYVRAIIGQPQIDTIRDSKDGKIRWIRLRVPVEEGKRYRVGTFTIADNQAVKTEPLRAMFKISEGDWYNHSKINKGLEKAKDVYGSFGYWQFTPEPQPSLRGYDPQTMQPINPGEDPPPIVDITIKMNEGKRYYVNRITFTGNTTTHDAVARRELQVYEEGPFNTVALKESIRRLNQLGYFKPLEGKPEEVDIQPTPGREGLVDIKLKFEEQNRNQISFGAGVSQYDGFFGQLSYQTSNFLGRGETLGINLQKGTRARQYMVSFSEPYLFDRPLTAGIELFARQYTYPYQFSQDSVGGTTIIGYPIARNARVFGGYGYEKTRVYDIEAAYLAAALASGNPYLRQSLLLDIGGFRRVSKIMPSIVYNTINVPIFPDKGQRYTASFELAGPGGNTYYEKMRYEGIWYFPIPKAKKLTLGMRGEAQWISPRGATVLPIFEKFFIGGEYTVRGFDMRTIGPRDSVTGIVTGGNKTLLFNAELAYFVAGPVRIIGFFDAGQVRDVGENFGWWEYHTRVVPFDRGVLSDPFSSTILTEEPYTPQTEVWAKSYAFKTSAGLELRFFMPVLNVPFRLIGSWNPSRFGVFNNNLQPTKQFTFRFAVGTTF